MMVTNLSDVPSEQEWKEMESVKNKSNGASLDDNSVLFMELKKKIMAFRDIFDFPPLNAAVPIHEPEFVPCLPTEKLKERSTHQALICFYELLKCIGDASSIEDNANVRDKFKHGDVEKVPLDELAKIMVTLLDGINREGKESFVAIKENEQPQTDYGLRPVSFGRLKKDQHRKSDEYDSQTARHSPRKPLVVLPKSPTLKQGTYSAPRLWNLRVQAIQKLSPKGSGSRLSFNKGMKNRMQQQRRVERMGSVKSLESRVQESCAMLIEAESVNSNDAKLVQQIPEIAQVQLEATLAPSPPPPLPSPHPPSSIESSLLIFQPIKLIHPEPPPPSPPSVVDSTMPTILPIKRLHPEPPAPSPPSVVDSSMPTILPTKLVHPEPPPPSPPSVVDSSMPTLLPIKLTHPEPPPPSPPSVVDSSMPTILPTKLVHPEPPPPSPPSVVDSSMPTILPIKLSHLEPPPPSPPSVVDSSMPTILPIKLSHLEPPPPSPPSVVDSSMPTILPTKLVHLEPPPPSPPSVVDSSMPTILPIKLIHPEPPSPSPPSVVGSSMPTIHQEPPSPSPPSVVNSSMPTILPIKQMQQPPPTPSPPLIGSKGGTPPPPPPIGAKGRIPAPPPPVPMGNKGGAPPPPPGALRLPVKKTTTLKRSSNMGNLYRTLKQKMEGSLLTGKTSGAKKIGGGSTSDGKGKSMADALAEMTKNSPFFKQIEEDVEKHGKSFKEMQAALTTFTTKDMDELYNFYKQVESKLGILADENQMIARFEGFPLKKLEALRMAGSMYNKLNGILADLQNWKFDLPLPQLLDTFERYITKIKKQLEDMERTKKEDTDMLQSHNIHFDFHILVKIKEAAVNVSSRCMELAIEERRATKAPSDDNEKAKFERQTKMLWRVFQLAYKVYMFAGGQDERAEKLTKELALEIESDPNTTKK